MSRTTTVINFSAPPDFALMIDRWAKKESKTKSELLRDAFVAYTFDQRLKQMQIVGREIADKLGLESFDEIEEYVEK